MKKLIIPATIISILIMALFTEESFATSGTPGSSSDPVVTKSYVDEQIASILNNISTNNNSGSNNGYNLSQDDYDALVQRITLEVKNEMEVAIEDQIKGVKPLHEPVHAILGQTIIGGKGTEIILRSGEAVIYSSVENGVTNLTTGINLDDNEQVAKDNLLIVPRNDGRGVTVTTDEAWFMIRGEYEIIG